MLCIFPYYIILMSVEFIAPLFLNDINTLYFLSLIFLHMFAIFPLLPLLASLDGNLDNFIPSSNVGI